MRLVELFGWERQIVQSYQRGVLSDRGVVKRVLEPGQYWTSASQTITFVDMRLQVLTVAGQEVLTSDGVSVKVSAAGEWTVADPLLYLSTAQSPLQSLYLYVQTAIREVLAGQSLEEVLKIRAELDAALYARAVQQAERIGVKLERLQIRDVMLPADVRRAMVAQVTAQKEGLAALERARGETAALRNLANAAKLMEDAPALVQLRALQSVEASRGNTLVLGVGGVPVVKGKEG